MDVDVVSLACDCLDLEPGPELEPEPDDPYRDVELAGTVVELALVFAFPAAPLLAVEDPTVRRFKRKISLSSITRSLQ